jgi:SAM-dependent methyltransferase
LLNLIDSIRDPIWKKYIDQYFSDGKYGESLSFLYFHRDMMDYYLAQPLVTTKWPEISVLETFYNDNEGEVMSTWIDGHGEKYKKKKILDVGSQGGAFCHGLNYRGFKVTGSDYNPHAICLFILGNVYNNTDIPYLYSWITNGFIQNMNFDVICFEGAIYDGCLTNIRFAKDQAKLYGREVIIATKNDTVIGIINKDKDFIHLDTLFINNQHKRIYTINGH